MVLLGVNVKFELDLRILFHHIVPFPVHIALRPITGLRYVDANRRPHRRSGSTYMRMGCAYE
jgi:hypothetical protein